MADPKGFLKVAREEEDERSIDERVHDWREITEHASDDQVRLQASRCMDCGIPFCHQGCPLGNLIPEWNDLVYRGKHTEAAKRLQSTNNFPEVTGRVCPAPCEASCVLNLRGEPVTIKTVERTIADQLFAESGGALTPLVPATRSGKTVAVVGSGPAGLAAAQQLARAGHDVVLFERDDRIGGLLRYGIPDFKMEKGIIDARMAQMQAEGVRFKPGVAVGVDVAGDQLLRDFDAVLLTMGARAPRDLPVPGRELDGVHFAMEFLTQQNRRIAGDATIPGKPLLAGGKHVVVIGGGDTGSDCVGTSLRQGAKSVTQIELMPKPPLVRMPQNPWPEWPLVLRTSSSQEEGAERDWAISTRSFRGESGRVVALDAMRVTLEGGKLTPMAGGDVAIPCDLALLAMGFVGPERAGLVEQLGLALDPRGNVKSDATGATNVPRVFAAGDVSRGQSLVVWAIADGRRAAAGVDAFLRTESRLARAG
jgi:glutamate synthase (NADPH/NADH) small chain